MEENQNESDQKLVYISTFFAGLTTIVLIYLLFATSCTYSITQVQTRGSASDVVDETATNTPNTSVSPTIKLPAEAIL